MLIELMDLSREIRQVAGSESAIVEGKLTDTVIGLIDRYAALMDSFLLTLSENVQQSQEAGGSNGCAPPDWSDSINLMMAQELLVNHQEILDLLASLTKEGKLELGQLRRKETVFRAYLGALPQRIQVYRTRKG